MKFIKQLTIIMAISFLAEWMEFLIPLPIAASVYGLVLMLFGLITKIIPLEKVEGAADFLIEIMPILFIPPTVSLIANVEALKQMLVPLFVISIVTTVLIMAVTGRVTQGIMRHDRRKKAAVKGAVSMEREISERDAAGEKGSETKRGNSNE